MIHATFNTKNILDKVGKLVDNMSKIDVDAAVTAALDEVADYLLEEMQKGVKRHYKDGDAYRAIKRTDVQRTGNYQSVEVGAMYIRAEDQDGFHVIYQEYGSPGRMAADPWLRPVLEKKSAINKIIIDIFKKWGVTNAKAA